ncbi:MAG: MarR family transcriptional regulator [Acidobacteriota bacterium]|nr:MarR family transcriptional regulator [Acidobacteriota bacterium]
MSISQNAQLLIKLSSLQSRVSKRVENQLSIHGISFTEFLVMYHLADSPGDNMRRIDLAERVGLTASGITRLLLPMEKIGLVEKESNPRDARVSLVKLTKTGRKIFGEASESFSRGADDFARPLSDAQSAKFTGLMEMLL